MPEAKGVQVQTPQRISSDASIRRAPSADDDLAAMPAEQRALVLRLSEEVAALRSALDASRHRIAMLEVEAAEDPASGLLNQRAFRRELERAASFGSRYRAPCAAALVAADGIAEVAIGEGSRAADRLLRRIGDRLRAAIRSCDVAARVESYRFGIVLWNAGAADCEHRLAVIRSALDAVAPEPPASLRLRLAATPIEAGLAVDQILDRLQQAIEAA